jgi:hypothetical protein
VLSRLPTLQQAASNKIGILVTAVKQSIVSVQGSCRFLFTETRNGFVSLNFHFVYIVSFFPPISLQNSLNEGDALSPLLFNFALEYVIRNFQENLVGLRLNGTHQLLAYADDVNLLRDNIDNIKKNMESLIDASKEVGLEINVEKTKYMLLSRHQNVGQNRDLKIANRSFGNVS